jgi:hypothetical protein
LLLLGWESHHGIFNLGKTHVKRLIHGRAPDKREARRQFPEAVTDPTQVKVELERGKRYAFEVDALKKENGFATAWMSLREPVPID